MLCLVTLFVFFVLDRVAVRPAVWSCSWRARKFTYREVLLFWRNPDLAPCYTLNCILIREVNVVKPQCNVDNNLIYVALSAFRNVRRQTAAATAPPPVVLILTHPQTVAPRHGYVKVSPSSKWRRLCRGWRPRSQRC